MRQRGGDSSQVIGNDFCIGCDVCHIQSPGACLGSDMWQQVDVCLLILKWQQTLASAASFDKFGRREEIGNQKHLPLSWDCWNKGFHESSFLPLLSTELTVDTRLDPSIFISIRILGSSVHDSLVFQRFLVNLSNQLQRRRHFDLPCVRCVYECAGPVEETQGVIHALMTLLLRPVTRLVLHHQMRSLTSHWMGYSYWKIKRKIVKM